MNDLDTTEVCGRKVRLARGDKVQTVNICTTANADGQYESIYKVPPTPVIGAGTIELRNFGSLDEFRTFLVEEWHGKLR